MDKHPIDGLMDTAMSNIKSMVDVNTIVGKPICAPDGTIIVPISKVGFGFGAGGSEFGAKKDTPTAGNDGSMFGGGCGGGASISPVAFLVVSGGSIRLLPMDGSSSPIDRVIDMVPDMINKVNGIIKDMSAGKKDDALASEPADADGESES
ncbi:MAG: GerW family sporulation protein [Oscillospiraceae bacterium]|nr:GerW family sporulation protein [Oscillospiraceae bacterium]